MSRRPSRVDVAGGRHGWIVRGHAARAKRLREIPALMGRSPARFDLRLRRSRWDGQLFLPRSTRHLVLSDLRATTSCDPWVSARLHSPVHKPPRTIAPVFHSQCPRRPLRRAGSGGMGGVGPFPEKSNENGEMGVGSGNGRRGVRVPLTVGVDSASGEFGGAGGVVRPSGQSQRVSDRAPRSPFPRQVIAGDRRALGPGGGESETRRGGSWQGTGPLPRPQNLGQG